MLPHEKLGVQRNRTKESSCVLLKNLTLRVEHPRVPHSYSYRGIVDSKTSFLYSEVCTGTNIEISSAEDVSKKRIEAKKKIEVESKGRLIVLYTLEDNTNPKSLLSFSISFLRTYDVYPANRLLLFSSVIQFRGCITQLLPHTSCQWNLPACFSPIRTLHLAPLCCYHFFLLFLFFRFFCSVNGVY